MLTPRGLLLAVLAAGLGAGAWAGGVLEFAAAGAAIAASILGAGALVLVRSAGRREMRPELLLPSGDVVASTAVSLGVVVRNVPGTLGGDVCVEDPTNRWDVRRSAAAPVPLRRRPLAFLLAPSVGSLEPLGRGQDGSTWSVSFHFPSAVRGLVRLPPLGVWCTDPLRLVAARMGTTPSVHRVVVPRPLTVSFPRTSHEPVHPEGADDFGDLRPYVPGDRLTHLHWPSLAAGREPLVRHFAGDGAPHLRLLLDLDDPAARERVVGAAAGLGIEAARQGAVVEIWTTAGEHWSVPPGPGAPSNVLRALATAGPDDAPAPTGGRQRPSAGVVAVTTPAGRDRLSRTTPLGGVVLVDPDQAYGSAGAIVPVGRPGVVAG